MADDIEAEIRRALMSSIDPEKQIGALQEVWSKDMEVTSRNAKRACHADTEYHRGRAEGALQAIKAFAKGSRRKA
jgi:hypothetical protein